MKQLLHTPEGVRDIYNAEYAKKLEVERRIRKAMELFGYRGIEPPTFEFFDIFRKERGSVSPREMFKFFDRDGETMVLRPDFTPSIARCASKYYMEESLPVRLSYMGNAFINESSLQGRLKEFTQAGVELIGDASADADAEVVALLIHCLLSAGLEDFQIEVGHAGFLRGLLEEAGMDEEAEEHFLELMENKNYFGIESLVQSVPMKDSLRHLFENLPELFNSSEQLAAAKSMTENPGAIEAIERMEELYRILEHYGVQRYVSFDLGMVVKYRYYTGIIYQGYTYGTGETIVSGGRYDTLLEQFGKDAPSVGFAIQVDGVMRAIERQHIAVTTDSVETMILYEKEQRELGISLAGHFRSTGMALLLMCREEGHTLEEYIEYGRREEIGGILYIEQQGEEVQVINIADGSRQTAKLSELMIG